LLQVTLSWALAVKTDTRLSMSNILTALRTITQLL
jgi:hypothetical protein